MHIPIVIIVLLAVGLFIFVTPYRQGVIDFFVALWKIFSRGFARLWNFLCGIGPTAGAVALTTGAIIGRVILFLALAIILFIIILYFTLGAGIMAAGIITGHWKAALLLLTALLFWGSLSVVPSIGMFRPLTIASRYVVRPVVVLLSIYLIICTGWWAIGQIAPEMHQSADRLMGNGSTELVDLMDSKSIETEGKLGKVGRIDDTNVFVYSEDGKDSELIKKGKKVRLVTSYKAGKVSTQSEGMVFVTLENKNGDFVWGDVRLIPPHRVNWDFARTDAEAKAKAEAEVAAKKAEAEKMAEAEVKAKAEAQAKTVQPQEETAKQFSFMEIQKLDGTSYQNRIVLVKMDQNCVEFTQIWGNGHSIKYSGQKAGESFFGNYRHTVDGRIEEGKFELNSKTLEGKFERPGNEFASFRLI